jgi:hypothetical protein
MATSRSRFGSPVVSNQIEYNLAHRSPDQDLVRSLPPVTG